MSLGKVIKSYRKSKHLTQEEMAKRLGVTAPAVNKWERGNAYPDITLLAPIARLLDISLDTLLSFQEDLTAEEIAELIREIDRMLKEKPYEEVFLWAKKKLEQYPNCRQLIWQIAVVLDAQRMVKGLCHAEEYDDDLCSWYMRVLESEDENLRVRAADSLVGFFMRKKEYDKAEEYLQYFSAQNPEKKRKLAQIYSETDRVQEAYRAYEELLFADYQRMSLALHGMYSLAVQTDDLQKARMLTEKQREIARCLEMGRYIEASSGLELAVREKDTDAVIAIMEEILLNIEEINGFRKSPLYEHMGFQEVSEEFKKELKKKLWNCLCDEETYGFLRESEKWERLEEKYRRSAEE